MRENLQFLKLTPPGEMPTNSLISWSGSKALKAFWLLILFFTFGISTTFAHVFDIRVNQAQNGSLTWYLTSYHDASECSGAAAGITINGVNYPISGIYAGDSRTMSSNLFAEDLTCQYRNTFVNHSNSSYRSYAVVQTPFLGTNLTVSPYSNDVCFSFCVGGSGSFTPPPPPVCTTSPLTGWSNTVAATGNNNGTPCNVNDDFIGATISVDHLACANITGDKQFRVIYDPAGASVSYGPFNYAAGVQTNVNITLPYGTSGTTQLKVIDDDFPAQITHALTMPNGPYTGEKDMDSPVFAAVSNTSVPAAAGVCGAVVTYATPVATDNCSSLAGNATPFYINASCGDGTIQENTPLTNGVTGISFGGSGYDGNVHGHGYYNLSVDLQVYSNVSNTWTSVQNLNVGPGDYFYDNTTVNFPVINGVTAIRFVANTYVSCAYHFNNLPVTLISGGGLTIAQTAGMASGSVFPVGTTTNTFVATDAAGNSTTSSFNVIVTDSENPTITAPNAVTVNTDNGNCFASNVNLGSAVANDNCSGVMVANNAPATFPTGISTVTWTATDAAGNTATAVQTVTVEDNEAPLVVTQNISVTLVNGTASITEAGIDNGSSDACGIASMVLNNTTFTCSDLGANTVTLTVTDNNGNSNSATATVMVIGAIPTPAIAVSRVGSNVNTGANENTIFLGYGNQQVMLTASNATSPAGATTYSWSPAAGLSDPTLANPVFTPALQGIYTFTVTATNEFGCSASEDVTITVINAVCGNKNDKVLICHNGNEICVSPSAVPAHLSHAGDKLGSCNPNLTNVRVAVAEVKNPLTTSLVAYPNPFNTTSNLEITLANDGAYKVEMLDMKGQLVKVIANEEGQAGKTYGYEIGNANLAAGMYMVRLVSASEVKYLKLMLDK